MGPVVGLSVAVGCQRSGGPENHPGERDHVASESEMSPQIGLNSAFGAPKHLACFRCLGVEDAAAALSTPASCAASCAAFRALPEEGLLSSHLFISPSVALSEAIDIFKAGFPDVEDEDLIEGFHHHGRPEGEAKLFGEIMDEAAALMLDDMQGECFHTKSSSRRATQCPLFTPVQHFFTAAGKGDPSEPPLAALLCPGARWRPKEKPLPPDRLQKQSVGLMDRVFVCASQSAVAVNNIALLSSALVSLSAGREAYAPEEAGLKFPGSPVPSSSYASL
ncbi:unnamed protein product [Boreogadus saida]